MTERDTISDLPPLAASAADASEASGEIGAYRAATLLAWAPWALTLLLLLTYFPLRLYWYTRATAPGSALLSHPLTPWRDTFPRLIADLLALPGVLASATPGALIVSRAHARRIGWIGWIYCAIGLTTAADTFCGTYAIVALLVAPGAFPAGLVAGWIQTWSWVVVAGLLFIFLPLLYPTSRLLSRRWRPVGVCAIALIGGGVGVEAVAPGPLDNYVRNFPAVIANPLGVAALDPVFGVTTPIAALLLLLLTFVAAASLLLRLRQSRGEEREQLKWFAYVAALLIALFVAVNLLSTHVPREAVMLAVDSANSFFALLAIASLPIATGLAILKYRLFDIDTLLNRTLVYGLLTGILGAIFVGGVIGLQTLVRTLTGQESPVALVVLTLVIVALFDPLRSRLQKMIDRRFYRAKYDAQKTLAAFSATLRQEVSLPALQSRLIGVVNEMMRPTHVSLSLAQPHEQDPAAPDGVAPDRRQEAIP
jgi:hypothetical protein